MGGLPEDMDTEDFVKILLLAVDPLNDLKNNSLYVSFVDGKFQSPAQVVKPRTAERTIQLAEIALESSLLTTGTFTMLAKKSKEELEKHFLPEESDPKKLDPKEMLASMRTKGELLGKYLAQQKPS